MTVAAHGDLPALVLSVPTGDDLDRITEICQDADIQEWTFVPRNYQRSDAEFFVEQVVAKGWSEGASSPGRSARPTPVPLRTWWACSASP